MSVARRGPSMEGRWSRQGAGVDFLGMLREVLRFVLEFPSPGAAQCRDRRDAVAPHVPRLALERPPSPGAH